MTTFNVSDIPTSINSYEKLSAWVSTVMNDLYGDQTVVENVNDAQLVAQSFPFYVTASNPASWRLISRLSIPLAPTWRRTGKIWTHAQDLGTIAVPTEFKS